MPAILQMLQWQAGRCPVVTSGQRACAWMMHLGRGPVDEEERVEYLRPQ